MNESTHDDPAFVRMTEATDATLLDWNDADAVGPVLDSNGKAITAGALCDVVTTVHGLTCHVSGATVKVVDNAPGELWVEVEGGTARMWCPPAEFHAATLHLTEDVFKFDKAAGGFVLRDGFGLTLRG